MAEVMWDGKLQFWVPMVDANQEACGGLQPNRVVIVWATLWARPHILGYMFTGGYLSQNAGRGQGDLNTRRNLQGKNWNGRVLRGLVSNTILSEGFTDESL